MATDHLPDGIRVNAVNPGTTDTPWVKRLLDQADDAISKNIFVAETVTMLADQLAFNVIDDETNMTILEQMYNDGQITNEAMQLLIDDEHDLFSDEFKERVLELLN